MRTKLTSSNRAKLTSAINRAETEREMITGLFHLLNATKPQVPVKNGLAMEFEDLLDNLLEEDTLSAYFGYWWLIFGYIDWANPKRSTGTRYGLSLLKFFGHLGDALREGGKASISRTAAIQLLMEFQEDDDEYAQYDSNDKGQWWIETTPKGEKAIGYPVKLDLPEPPPTRWYDAPLELFDHVFNIERSI